MKDKYKDNSLAVAYSVQRQARKKMAMGGMVADDTAEHYESIADAILAKKRKAMDTDATNHEDPNMFEELDEQAVGSPDSDEPEAQPMDSNEDGSGDENEVDEQQDDTISVIRRKMKAKKS